MAAPIRDWAHRAAKEAGQKRYSGKKCEECGSTERFTCSRMCVVCLPRKTKQWRKANGAHVSAYARDYKEHNADAMKAATAAYREQNRDARRALCRRWKKENPHRNTAIQMKRHAGQMRRTPPWLTKAHYAEIDEMYRFAKVMERISGQKYHVDHITPLQGKTVSGLHVPWNLQALPAVENQRKSNTFTF